MGRRRTATVSASPGGIKTYQLADLSTAAGDPDAFYSRANNAHWRNNYAWSSTRKSHCRDRQRRPRWGLNAPGVRIVERLRTFDPDGRGQTDSARPRSIGLPASHPKPGPASRASDDDATGAVSVDDARIQANGVLHVLRPATRQNRM